MIKNYFWENRRFLLMVFAFLTVRAVFADHYRVPSGSMLPTIEVGDHIGVFKAAYGLRVPLTKTYLFRWAEPQNGDVVVFKSPHQNITMVKRVVAGPGETVEWFGKRYVVPDGHYFVMGDNRGNSSDSRVWGSVPFESLLGRAEIVAFSATLFPPRLNLGRVGLLL